ncbi:MAG: TetR/AcrR family transcriptional regulator [Thermodesulfobacteriota bacterium]
MSRVFSSKGYNETNIRELAKEAGIHSATIYHYFQNKQEILRQIYDEGIGELLDNLTRIVNSDKPPDEKMRDIIKEHVTFVTNRQPVIKILFREEEGLPANVLELIRAQKRQYNKIIEEVFAEGIREELFEPTSSLWLQMNSILSMCTWVYKWYKPQREYNAENISQHFIEILENGYCVSKKKDVNKAPIMIDSEKTKLSDSYGRIKDIVNKLQLFNKTVETLIEELNAILKKEPG